VKVGRRAKLFQYYIGLINIITFSLSLYPLIGRFCAPVSVVAFAYKMMQGGNHIFLMRRLVRP
jgi:hypothetical protein